jgi:hypothetical protein
MIPNNIIFNYNGLAMSYNEVLDNPIILPSSVLTLDILLLPSLGRSIDNILIFSL